MNASITVSRSRAASDISGTDGAAVVRAWAFVGAGFITFMLYVVYHWVTAPYFGPTELAAGVEVPLQFKIGVHAVEIGMSLVWIYVLPMPLLTANADPFPDDTPAFFTVGTGMCGPGTGLACPRLDLPIQRRNDLDKFSDTPQISHEQAAGDGGAGKPQ